MIDEMFKRLRKYEANIDTYTTREERLAANKKWRAEQDALNAQFKIDALRATGLDQHPNADKLFKLAWDTYHSDGLWDVLSFLAYLADALK